MQTLVVVLVLVLVLALVSVSGVRQTTRRACQTMTTTRPRSWI